MIESIRLRAVQRDDLPELFAHQNDPVANTMAAFPPRDQAAFMQHWTKILADDSVVKRTILSDASVAGNVLCFQQDDQHLLGYWLGRRFWGKGIATIAVAKFVSQLTIRPLYAHVAATNRASKRVLEKCGFETCGERDSQAATGGDVVDEYIFVLRD